jgi:phosphate transport system protein
MKTYFHEELNDLKIDLLKMSSLVEKALTNSLKAYSEMDKELAEEVIKNDKEINKIEVQIDRQCLSLLARYQPMATDLRFITASMRINFDLERISDQAVNISESVIELAKRPPLGCCLEELSYMAQVATEMVTEAVNAFVYNNKELAYNICKKDNEIDDLTEHIFRTLLDFMTSHSPAVKRGTHLIIITRCWERIADHATNIAEHVIFLLKGEIIRHKSLD